MAKQKNDPHLELFGIENIGNTCYLNTTLQCLFSCKKFNEHILTQKLYQGQDLSSSLQSILTDHQDRRKAVKSLIRTLMKKVNWFKFLQHNDINEFVTLLFDQLNMEIYTFNKLDIRPVKYSSQNSTLSTFMTKATKSWYNFVKNENTWFNNMCTGQLVHQIICGNCNKIHHNFETFRSLDVELPADGAESEIRLEYCVENFFQKQFINHENNTQLRGTSTNQDWTCSLLGNSLFHQTTQMVIRPICTLW